jgi:cytochrome c oxidase assembly protein subunit 15
MAAQATETTRFSSTYRATPHWVALFGTVFTWPLLFVGGLVTTYRVGMAVPDWPTTFGANMFLYRFWNASWGVFVEHGHRLYGSAVGLACVILAVWFLIAERRGWLKLLGVLTLLAVIGQGVLGGVRVQWNSQLLAAVHGCTGQAFFGLMAALCVFTSRSWMETGSRRVDAGGIRRKALITLVLIYSQVIAGASLRHFSAGLVVHIVLALATWGHAAGLCWRVLRDRAAYPDLRPSATAMAVLITVQVALGVAALVSLWPIDGIPREVTTLQAVLRTGHQANGALLLASSVALTLRAFKGLTRARHDEVGGPSGLPQELEAVA